MPCYRLQLSIAIPIYLSILVKRTDGPPRLSRLLITSWVCLILMILQVPMGRPVAIDYRYPWALPSPSMSIYPRPTCHHWLLQCLPLMLVSLYTLYTRSLYNTPWAHSSAMGTNITMGPLVYMSTM